MNTRRIQYKHIVLTCTVLGTCQISTLQAKPVSVWPTLNGDPTLVIAHRGYSGLVPEETLSSYELAAEGGADSLELDLHMSKDCQLVARHNAWLSDNTNVKEVAKTRPEVERRQRQEFVVDGEKHDSDWSISDFTFQELKTWLGGTTYDAADERPKDMNGLLSIVSLQEVIDLAKSKSKSLNRTIGIYPELKNPTWNNQEAIKNGCGKKGSRPFEDEYLRVLNQNGLNHKSSGVYTQSFETSTLKYLKQIGHQTWSVQLIGANDYDFAKGGVLYNDIANSRPYDWTAAGKTEQFDTMLSPKGLKTIKTYADGIGVWKPQIMPLKITAPNTEAKAKNATIEQPTSLIKDAHDQKLFVHVYTFRNEPKYLAASYQNDPINEYMAFFKLGVDGVFTDFTSTAVKAKQQFAKANSVSK